MNIRTIDELIDTLTEIRDNWNDEHEDGVLSVKVAFQPNYPLVGALYAVTRIGDKVYVSAGEGRDYGPRGAWAGGEWDSEEEANESI